MVAEVCKILSLVLNPRLTNHWKIVDGEVNVGEQTSVLDVGGTKTNVCNESWFSRLLVLQPRITEPTAAVAKRSGRDRYR